VSFAYRARANSNEEFRADIIGSQSIASWIRFIKKEDQERRSRKKIKKEDQANNSSA
tara:strand:- start:23438 stop:23608 length:171 start_codon:yes stop_codon:yes gene_type:complete